MPEGHKTHFLARQHCDQLCGDRLRVTSPQGRFRTGAKRLCGATLTEVAAIGKQMFYRFDNDLFLHIHLGRYGKFRTWDSPPPPPVGLVRVRLAGSHTTIDLNGPTTCRVVDAAEKDQVVRRIGPDPLAGGSASQVAVNFSKTKRPVGAVLLDQTAIAGVGNIFRAEALFEIGLNPRRPANALSDSEFKALWSSVTRMMRKGLKYGRIITVSTQEAGCRLVDLDGNDRFRIYGHEQCPRCGDAIETDTIGGRTLYYCASCQSD